MNGAAATCMAQTDEEHLPTILSDSAHTPYLAISAAGRLTLLAPPPLLPRMETFVAEPGELVFVPGLISDMGLQQGNYMTSDELQCSGDDAATSS